MLSEFSIKSEYIYPICVIATMSAGKSTFINSLLGAAVLPEKNEACTSRALAVINDSSSIVPEAYIIKKDGSKIYTELNDRTTMYNINNDENISSVLIKTRIPFAYNINRNIVIFDTPGVNNSADIKHEERTNELLKKMNQGTIVYVLNATQLATNDDALLLQQVSNHIKKFPDIKICFVLNKIDMLDEDKESVESIVSNAISYISSFEINNPIVFPLSAMYSKVMRLHLFSKQLTQTEERYLKFAYSEYKPLEKSMVKYSYLYNNIAKEYIIDGTPVSEYELKRAIDNTGIEEIENQIIRFAFHSDTIPLKCTFETESYIETEGVYSKKRKTKNYVNYEGKAKWICKKCRQINGDNNQCLYCNENNITWSVF